MNKGNIKKISSIVVNTCLCIFLLICICSVFLTVFSKKDSDGAATIFGYQMRIVTSDSMAESEFTDVSAYKIKDIPIRSMVFIKVKPEDPAKLDDWYRSLKVGDVVTFRYVYTTQVTITHRITSITEKETGGFIIEMVGDNKNSEDGQLVQTIDTSIKNNPNYIIGKVTMKTYLFGMLMSFMMKPIGIVMIIIVPCVVIILFEILKIINVFGAEKKKKDQEEKAQRENELNELRKKLEALEKEKLYSSSKSQEEDVSDSGATKEEKIE